MSPVPPITTIFIIVSLIFDLGVSNLPIVLARRGPRTRRALDHGREHSVFVPVSPDGKTVFVANSGNGTVSVINTATNAVTATVTVGARQRTWSYPDGKTAYVTNQSTVTPIDTATNTAGTPISVGAGTSPFGLTVSPTENALCEVANGGGSVATINTATNTAGSSIVTSGGQFPGICSNGNALLASGLIFVARTSGALACTLASGPTGAPGPVFTGGTMQFAGAGIASALPISLQGAGGTFDTNGNNAVLSGMISGSGSLTKIGIGTLTLSGSNTYTGGTFVNAGTLQAGAGAPLAVERFRVRRDASSTSTASTRPSARLPAPAT